MVPFNTVEPDLTVNLKEQEVTIENIKLDEEQIVTVDRFLMHKESSSRDLVLEAEDDLITGKGEFVCMGSSKERMEFSKAIKFNTKFIVKRNT